MFLSPIQTAFISPDGLIEITDTPDEHAELIRLDYRTTALIDWLDENFSVLLPFTVWQDPACNLQTQRTQTHG